MAKMEYTRDEKKALCKKYHENFNNEKSGFDGFTLRDRIALAEWQVEILNGNSKIESVRKSYKKWEMYLIEFKKELLIQESEVILLRNGSKIKAARTNKGFVTWCKCEGSGRSPYNNICSHCYGKGYIQKPLIEATKEEYFGVLKDKYYKTCKKRNELPHPNAEEQGVEFFETYLAK